MIPGSHIAVVSRNPPDALSGRFQGWELRDTLLVITPGPSAFYVFLFRVPLEESTIAAQVLKTGTGGLNIDACRISSGVRQATAGVRTVSEHKGWGVGQGGSGYIKGTGALFTIKGRWPSNLLLIHHSDCVNEGTKKVKACGIGSIKKESAKELQGNTGSAYGAESRPLGTPMICYADSDGLETIQAWNCHPICPVGLLDRQSGTSFSSGGSRGAGGQHGRLSPISAQPEFQPGYKDIGGASRFYPQFKNLAECLDWIDRLINSV